MLAKKQGKIFVGGTAAGVVPSGGYVQGAGHSALAPLFGLAADNALRKLILRIPFLISVHPFQIEFEIVIADGSILTVNSVSHPDRRHHE